MKNLLNKLKEARISNITQEDFIKVCNQSDLFQEYVEYLQNDYSEVIELEFGKIHKLEDFNLYLVEPNTFTKLFRRGLQSYVGMKLNHTYFADWLADSGLGSDEDMKDLLSSENSEYMQDDLNKLLIEIGTIDSIKGIEVGFSRVNLDGIRYILVG